MADEGLTYAEIGQQLRVSASAVGQRLRAAGLAEGRRGAELVVDLLARADGR
jgi:DNA-directed RNA polymerase specialized sigma24 family protein